MHPALLLLLLLPADTNASADEYTRYELLAPETSQFRILYEVTATTPGAAFFYNPIRKGSLASDESVYDVASGKKLGLEIVPGDRAKSQGFAEAELDVNYLRIELPRKVPADGGVRLLVDKTYKDPKSYFSKDGKIVFARSLSIRRNSVVLPVGYELVECNVPAQVLAGADGRTVVSFMNPFTSEANVVVEARKLK